MLALAICASTAFQLSAVHHNQAARSVHSASLRLPFMKLDDVVMEEAFKKFDTDSSGFLDKTELKAVFEASGNFVSDDSLSHAFSIVDKNHDGQIDLEEFKAIAVQSERFDFLSSLSQIAARDNGHTFEVVEENPDFQRIRDERLAKKNTRAYCLDRCLATGYCDVLEDLLTMTTMQVKKFCDSCSGEDECQLEYA
jgi:hypothetical protein